MKKMMVIAASVLMMVVAANSGSAEMVDIGTGAMEASELAALKAMVEGRRMPIRATISTPVVRPELYGMVAMTPEAFQALRDAVDGRGTGSQLPRMGQNRPPMVDIGTGQMPHDEFMALKQMIEGQPAAAFSHLAAILSK